MRNEIKKHREDLKIEGNRNLFSYTFTDSAGNVLKPEPTLPSPDAQDEGPKGDRTSGNLNPQQGEKRPG